MSKSKVGSSLELLLDTICNTFGGILFISMLVVLLLNATGKRIAHEPPDKAAQARLASLTARSREEIARLRKALAEQEKTAKTVGWSPELVNEVKRLKAVQENRAGLAREKGNVLNETAESQRKVNQIVQDLKDLEDKIARARQNLAGIELELETELRIRSRTVQMPKMRTTTKREVPIFLRGGRLSSYAKRGPAGRLVPNVAECEEKSDAEGLYIQPKQGVGTTVNLQGDPAGAVAARVTEFDKDHDYLAIFVWPDSFRYFAVVKNIMVRNGFEYRLVPFPGGDKIRLTTAPRNAVQVQ